MVTHVFMELKENFERTREFKVRLVERILRQTLRSLSMVAKRQRYVRSQLLALFRDRTRVLASRVMHTWLNQAQR